MRQSLLCERIWVTRDGRAFLDRTRELTQSLAGAGYLRVQYRSNGKAKTLYVHRLVASAYCHRPAGCSWVTHVDRNLLNNDAANLQWVTASYVRSRLFAEGLDNCRGSNNKRSKLTESSVMDIIAAVKGGSSQAMICRELGISSATVSNIVTGKIWKHVSREVSNG